MTAAPFQHSYAPRYVEWECESPNCSRKTHYGAVELLSYTEADLRGLTANPHEFLGASYVCVRPDDRPGVLEYHHREQLHPRRFRHARDITDGMFMAAVREACMLKPWATRWDVEAALGGMPVPRDFSAYPEVPGVPPKVVLAKAKRLIKRGLLSGCACGCRGDFAVVD